MMLPAFMQESDWLRAVCERDWWVGSCEKKNQNKGGCDVKLDILRRRLRV